MDKSWIWSARVSKEYEDGVEGFVNFATLNSENRRLVRCLCNECCNLEFHTPEWIKGHLFQNGFFPTYIVWDKHGEVDSNAALASCPKYYENHEFRFQDHSNVEDMFHDAYEQCDQNPKFFRDILKDAEKPLYLGSKHSKLSGLMKLYYVKGKYEWSNQGFSALLEVLSDIF